MIFRQNFNNFTVIYCIVAKFSSHSTDIRMVILQHLFWRKKNILIEYTIEKCIFMICMKKYPITLL